MTCPTPAQAFVPTTDNTRQLRDAFARFATGVTIVTARTDSGPIGITVNSFSSVSLDPPLVLWCADLTSRRYDAFAQAQHYAIHVLSSTQSDLCWQIAKDGAALTELNLDTNVEGVPILADCLARFECERRAVYPGGDHGIILGQVLRASFSDLSAPLTFFGGEIRHIASQG